jgi:signal transduction histidine kinase
MTGELPPAFTELEDAVTLFSRDGRPLDCHLATRELIGYSRAEFLEASLAELIVPQADLAADDVQTHIRTAAEEGCASVECRCSGPTASHGGSRRRTPITLDDTQRVMGELQDLTAYKARGCRLQLLYRVLRHNLRNEMSAIQAHATRLEDAIESDNLEHQAEIIRETAAEVGELSEIVADLERLVERDATERERANVAAVIRRGASRIQRDHPDTDVRIAVETDVGVSADEGFVLALDHALTKAVEHNDTAEPELTVTVNATDREAVIRIADNGPGIPEMEIEALATEPTSLEHGSGLGLSIIRWCTQSLGGTVDIRTSAGEGSTLTIRLPRLVQDGQDR